LPSMNRMPPNASILATWPDANPDEGGVGLDEVPPLGEGRLDRSFERRLVVIHLPEVVPARGGDLPRQVTLAAHRMT